MSKKLKIPKRMAGVKIPKAIRKGPVRGFLASPGGQLLVAQALVLADGILANRKIDPQSRAGELLELPLESMADGGNGAQAERLYRACREVLEAFRAVLEDEEGADEADEASRTDGAKKESVATTGPSTPH